MTGVGPGRVVTLEYLMRNTRQEVLEDRRGAHPAEYLHGGDQILPALQRQLEGLLPGGHRQVKLSRGDAPAAEFYFEVTILSVRQASPEEVLLGYPLPVAADCGPDCVCYPTEKS